MIGFWGLIENSLMAVLFLIIGLELLVIDLSWSPVIWSLIVMPLILVARFVALVIPWLVARLVQRRVDRMAERKKLAQPAG